VPPALRAVVRQRIDDHRRREDAEIEALNSSPDYSIHVLRNSKTITLNVKGWWTIGVVKAKIQNQEGIKAHRFELVKFGSGVLLNNMELQEVDVQDGAHLFLIEDSKNITVTISSIVDNFTIGVKSSDTIATVKAKIQEKKGYAPDQQLLSDQPFDGKHFENDHTLSDYNISDGGALFLSAVASFGWVQGDRYNIFSGTVGGSSSSGGGAGMGHLFGASA
jgi:hypothetical protein